MPKYKNSGTSVVTLGSTRIEPGQTISTTQFIPGSLPAGITEESTLPVITPIISSAKLTTGTIVTIPETITDPITGETPDLNGNYMITVYVAVGEATVQLNGQGVARYVGLYETYRIQCLSRTVDTLVVTPTGTTFVTVEKI